METNKKVDKAFKALNKLKKQSEESEPLREELNQLTEQMKEKIKEGDIKAVSRIKDRVLEITKELTNIRNR